MPYFEPIPPHVERAAKETIGAAIEVHRVLGPGFLERIYQEALCIELKLRGISFERERPILVHYRGVEIPGQRIDLIVNTCLVVELKAASRFEAAHHGAGRLVFADHRASAWPVIELQLSDAQGWNQENHFVRLRSIGRPALQADLRGTRDQNHKPIHRERLAVLTPRLTQAASRPIDRLPLWSSSGLPSQRG